MSQVVDLYVLYQIIKRISTPFEETDAYKLGLIDDKGKRLKKASSSEEKKAMTYLDRFVFNIKRTLQRAGLDSRMGTYAGALLLIKESHRADSITDKEIVNGILEEYSFLNENTNINFDDLFTEDAPAMATGTAVAGTGDDPVHWGKPKGRPRKKGKPIDAIAFLKRMNKKYTNS